MLRTLARERRRFGYRRLHVLLRREGFVVNHKRLFRIYRKERLMVRKRGGRKRALGIKVPIPAPAAAQSPRVADFASDQTACGRRFRRILAIFDDYGAQMPGLPSLIPHCPAAGLRANLIA